MTKTKNDTEEDWGRELGRMIGRAEARVASYKKLVSQAWKNGDDGLKSLFKAIRQAEEKSLKALRQEKTDWNAGMWCHPSTAPDYDDLIESEDKILELLENLGAENIQ